MNRKVLYISILASLFTLNLFAYDKDTLSIDTSSHVVVHELPKHFKEKYQGDEFVYEYVIKSKNPSVWSRFMKWLSHLFDDWFGFDSPVSARRFTEYFIKTIYFVAFIAILYLIAKTLLKKEGNWIFGRSSNSLDISIETLEADVLGTDFENLIVKAEKELDFRLATRYFYLKTLQLLASKEMIEWDPEKTNYDYYMEIAQERIQQQFQYISYLYNYSWYGEFEIDETAFNEVKNAFNTLFRSIR